MYMYMYAYFTCFTCISALTLHYFVKHGETLDPYESGYEH